MHGQQHAAHVRQLARAHVLVHLSLAQRLPRELEVGGGRGKEVVPLHGDDVAEVASPHLLRQTRRARGRATSRAIRTLQATSPILLIRASRVPDRGEVRSRRNHTRATSCLNTTQNRHLLVLVAIQSKSLSRPPSITQSLSPHCRLIVSQTIRGRFLLRVICIPAQAAMH